MKNLQGKKKLACFLGIIFVFHLITGAIIAEGGKSVIPTEDQLKQLVNKTMLDFALAIKARDFTGFYYSISEFWQEQTTKEELYDIFRSFIDQDIDLTVLQEYEPMFTQKPYLDKEGWLIVQGHYPTRPSVVYFTLKYLDEKSAWKLVGINVNVKPEEEEKTGEIPPEAKLKQLVKKTMLDFALAIKARDFTGFYHNISKVWQEQTTKEELFEIFKSFSDQNIDLTILQDLEPIFTAEAFLDEDGLLVLQGRYPTEPSVVYFEMDYIYEDSDWKLFGINVNVTPEEEEVTGESLSDAQLMQLANKTMLEFALAVTAKDFTGFYQNIAALWQEQTNPEELYEAFRIFADQDIDLTILQEYEPIFTEEPYFDEDDWLILQGRYPTEPSVIYFELKYVYEEALWKLVGLNVNIE